MPRTVCIKCNVGFKIYFNGAILVSTFNEDEEYELYSADIWICPKCKHEIVAGIANEPFATHYKDDLKEIIKKAKERGVPVIYEYER